MFRPLLSLIRSPTGNSSYQYKFYIKTICCLLKFSPSESGVSEITRRCLGYISYTWNNRFPINLWPKVISSYLIMCNQLPLNQLYKILLIRYLMLFIFSWKTRFHFLKNGVNWPNASEIFIKLWTSPIVDLQSIYYHWFY